MRATSVIVALLLLSARAEAACLDPKTEEHLKQLMMSSIDDALHDYIKTLFTVWVRDEKLDTPRARQGMHNALRAWVRGRKAIERWDIPEC